MQQDNATKRVTIFGGSGFLGRYITRDLAQKGYHIRIAVRRPSLAGHLEPFGEAGQIQLAQTNVFDEATVNEAMEGANFAINLTGILYESGKQTFHAIHKVGAENIARAAQQNNLEGLIHVSAIGADPRSPSKYAQTKGEGEAATLNHFPGAIVLRPSIVFGPEDDFFNRFGSMATYAPALPLVGGGKTRFQPVYVDDVAKAVTAAIEGKATLSNIYELGGPTSYSFKELLQKTLDYTNRKAVLIPIPFAIATIQGAIFQLLPKPLLTVDQVKLLRHDNIVSSQAKSEHRTLQGLGIDKPQSVEEIVPNYLQRFRRKT